MGLFKGHSPTKVVDDTTEIVTDFIRRAPFWSYRTVPYRPYPPLMNLQTELDGCLDRLFSGELDDGNGDVLDCLIFDQVRQAREDLNRQRVSHRDAIVSFGLRALGDREAFETQLAALKQALEQNEAELTLVQHLARRDTYQKEAEQHA